jgi:hypothetical protein
MSSLRIGDRVSWTGPQGEALGRIVAKRERDFDLAEEHFTASVADPSFIVQSESTGAKGAHKAAVLTKTSSGGGGDGGGGEGR